MLSGAISTVHTGGAQAAAVPSVVARPSGAAFHPDQADRAFLADLEHRTFQWFWTAADPATGLVPDR